MAASPVDAPVPAPVSVRVAESKAIKCLLDVFQTLRSWRDPRGVRYGLSSTLALVVIALLAGCKNRSQIYAFAEARPGLLSRLGFRPPKRPRRPENRGRITAPNEDTIGAILASVDQSELNERLAVFVGRMVAHGAVCAVDGKALRGSGDYVLSVFVNAVGQVAWQQSVDKKQSELKVLERALPEILAQWPQLRLFTGDAAFCHKTLARALVAGRRDYFLQLKGPHQTDVALANHSFKQLRHGVKPLAHSEEKRGARTARNG